MSKKVISKKAAICLAVAAVAVAAGGIGIYASSSYGTSSDPLITKSYIDSVLMPQIQEMAESSAEDEYTVLTLKTGQQLTCEPGCEIMLRIGSASASGSDSPALIDTTDGTSLESGKTLNANHLYMVTISGNGIKAGSSTTKILIKGIYTIS